MFLNCFDIFSSIVDNSLDREAGIATRHVTGTMDLGSGRFTSRCPWSQNSPLVLLKEKKYSEWRTFADSLNPLGREIWRAQPFISWKMFITILLEAAPNRMELATEMVFHLWVCMNFPAEATSTRVEWLCSVE